MAVTAPPSEYKDMQSSYEFGDLNITSQNVCLRGVYVSNNVKCFKRCRGVVVESKNRVLFPLRYVSERSEIVHFTNEEDAERFFGDLSNFGYSAALQNHRNNPEKKQNDDLHTFYNRSLFCVVNICEWKPHVRDFSLSRLAIRHLQDIEKKLMDKDVENKAAQEECISFFQMFGTHAYLTNVTLGGIFSISAQTALQRSDDVDMTKNMVQQIHNQAISDHLSKHTLTESGGMEENEKENFKLREKVEITHTQFGGPQAKHNFTKWKSDLMTNSATWTVNDMGEISFEKCIGIWSLVKKHCGYFSNADELSYFLAQVWMDQVSHGIESKHMLASSWQSFAEHLKTTTPSSASCHLESLEDLKEFLEENTTRVGKPMLIDSVDVLSEMSVQTLFHENAKPDTPKCICFRILTTKLHILQIVKRKISAADVSWIPSDYFIPGVLSQREFNGVEELLDLLESELLPGIGALQACNCVDFKRIQSLTKTELGNTVQNFLQKLIDRKEYREALLLFVISISIGYHIKREEIRANITYERLETFISSAKGELSLAKKCKSQESQEAWLLLRMIFKLDTKFRLYDASTVLAHEFDNVVRFMTGKGFIFHSNIKDVIDSKCKQDSAHEVIHALVEISRFPCEVFDGERMRELNTSCPESRLDSENSPALQNIIKIFGMKKFFPQKLTTEVVLKLSNTLFTSPEALEDIPWAIFQHVIAINYNFRDRILYDFLKKSNASQSKRGRQNTNKKHNPMDVFLALWHCCDLFLKKILASKITTCQLALPFIYEDIISKDQLTISLWPLRDIFIDDSPDSVLTKPLKTVSFIRVGNLKSISKSRVINKLIREDNNEHSTFYHRDCALATNKRLVSNGLIEITWYVPRKNNDEVNSNESDLGELMEGFSEPICILNMRGDTTHLRTQLLALLAISDVVVVMSEFQSLKDEHSLEVLKQVHSSSSVPIIMTNFPEIEENAEEGEDKEEDSMSSDNSEEDLGILYREQTGLDHQNTLFLSTLDMGEALNESELKDCLTTQMVSALKHIKCPQSLERKKMLLPKFVAIDEDNGKSKYGLNLSEMVFADVEYSASRMQRKHIKDNRLPLQGENVWQAWCLEHKQCCRSGKTSVSDNDHHKKTMKTLRLWQILYGLETQNTIVKFVHILANHIEDRQTITYFLQYLKFDMDCQSRQVIPQLSNDLFKAFREYETLRSQPGVDKKEVETMKLKIKSAEENMAKASFGLEHFFREMGQLYESLSYGNEVMGIRLSTKTKPVLEKMPYIAAKLLSWGHPLEIMDGDAASVPECWIKAVFKEIRSIIGENKTLYVISILGIQSSGKSTLLNTMFGLQFSVSAGRCTRGIYMQLIPVDKSKSSLKFDYALVIDTEGLRAPELAGEKFNHDNELATLVIGLADVALINIKGETIADMQDVLQIVVHALIRLKNANEELNIQQSCVFVHQNVSAINAGKSTFQGSQKVTSVLDDMTKHIAQQEKMANITRFTDVIAFNPVTNVIHVPDLWQGVPPMAPASPEYSKMAVQVATCILGDICKNKKGFLTTENTSIHLENLWKGIVSEDFVFSFRNGLEIKAFNALEMKFQSFVWTLQELKLQYLQDTVTQICCSENPDKLMSTINRIQDCFNKSLTEKTESCNKDLQTFFDNSDLSEYMVHWRARKTEELKAISQSITFEINTKIEMERGKCEAFFNSNQKLSSVRENVSKKAILFAKSAKTKGNEMSKTDLEKQFEVLWKEWLGEVAPALSEDGIQNKIDRMKIQLKSEIEKKISGYQNMYNTVSTSMKHLPYERLHMRIGCIDEYLMDEKDIEVIGIKEKVKSFFGKFAPEWIKDYLKNHKHYYEGAKHMLDIIFSDIEKYVKTRREDVEYNSAEFIQVLNYITDGFRNHNENSNVHGFMVTHRLEMKTTLMVEKYVVHHFTEHIKRYEKENSLRSKMAKYKEEEKSLFLGVYFQTANAELATSMICNHLEDPFKQKIRQELHDQMFAQVTHSEFGNRKEPLIKEVLTDLARKEDFREYISYIGNSKHYVKSWIQNYTLSIFEGEKYQQCTKSYLKTACLTVQRCATEAMVECKTNNTSKAVYWKEWVKMFREKLVKNNFPMPPDCFQTVTHLEVEELDSLVKELGIKVGELKESISESFKRIPLSRMDWKGTDPYTKIIDNLWGCEKNCPWCLEPCVVTSSKDKHRCKQHRPEGIAGAYWIDTDKLICESCEFSVQSTSSRRCGSWCKCRQKSDAWHPCKEFKEHMKDSWDISGSSDMSSSKYWTWVFKNFEKDFVKHYNRNSPDFPDSDAFEVKKADAINSLSLYR